MTNILLVVFKYLFLFLVLVTIFIIVLISKTNVSAKKQDINTKNVKFYGLFLDLTNKQLISISLSLLKLIFLIYLSLMFNVNVIGLLFIMSIVILYNIINVRFINFFVDLILHTLLYFILLSKDIFFTYLRDISIEWYVIIFLIISIIFALLLSFILFFNEIQYVIKKNDYVRKKLNKDLLLFGVFKKKQLNNVINKVSDKEGTINERQNKNKNK